MSPFPGWACLVSQLARLARCDLAAPPWSDPSRFAVVGLVDEDALAAAPGLAVRVGSVSKHPEPLLVQDRPWELRLDNSYPNIAHIEGDPLGSWRLWYGGCKTRVGCTGQFLLYANSSDGYHWEKPSLGLYNVSANFNLSRNPFLASEETANNILFAGGGAGVYHDISPRRGGGRGERFKAMANWQHVWTNGREGGSRVSGDGIHWSELKKERFPLGLEYDSHTNIVWDPREGRYIVTHRWKVWEDFKADPRNFLRTIGILWSHGADFDALSRNVGPVLEGTESHQLYSMVTVPFYNIYLGFVTSLDKAGIMSCRLAWSPRVHGPWSVVGGITAGPEAIPRGPPGSFDSHVVFAAAHPVPVKAEGGRVRLYYMGGNGPHGNKTFGRRNSSLGLATLRPEGFIALGGTGALTASVPVLCTGPRLTVTADIVAPGGRVRIGVAAATDVAAAGGDAPRAFAENYMEPILSNVTHAEAVLPGGRDLGHLQGRYVMLRFELSDAFVYTVGFEQAQQDFSSNGPWGLATLLVCVTFLVGLALCIMHQRRVSEGHAPLCVQSP